MEKPRIGKASAAEPTSTRHWPFRGSNEIFSDASSPKSSVNVDAYFILFFFSLWSFSCHSCDPRKVNIEVNEIHQANSPDINLTDLSVYGEAMIKRIEKQTFADELLALTIGERKKSRRVARVMLTDL